MGYAHTRTERNSTRTLYERETGWVIRTWSSYPYIPKNGRTPYPCTLLFYIPLLPAPLPAPCMLAWTSKKRIIMRFLGLFYSYSTCATCSNKHQFLAWLTVTVDSSLFLYIIMRFFVHFSYLHIYTFPAALEAKPRPRPKRGYGVRPCAIVKVQRRNNTSSYGALVLYQLNIP